MKRIYAICFAIMSCFMFAGCEFVLRGIVEAAQNSKDKDLSNARGEAQSNRDDALTACYQLSGASEAKFRIMYNDTHKGYNPHHTQTAKRIDIIKKKATKNGTLEQIEQCLKSFNEIANKKEKCEKDDIDCYKEANESYLAFIKSLEPKLKNVKFTCSQADEMRKYGPKFDDKDIESYALELIDFKPIVSKDIMESIDRANFIKELEQYEIDDVKWVFDAQLKQQCVYKMQYYAGDLNKLDGFKKSGMLASKISKGYDDFIKRIKKSGDDVPNKIVIMPEYDNSADYVYILSAKTINDELANITKKIKEATKSGSYIYNDTIKIDVAKMLARKAQYEAILKFLEEK